MRTEQWDTATAARKRKVAHSTIQSWVNRGKLKPIAQVNGGNVFNPDDVKNVPTNHRPGRTKNNRS